MDEYMVIPMEVMSHEQACQEYGAEMLDHLLQLDDIHCGREDNEERELKDKAQGVDEKYYSTNTLENITMLNYYSLRKLIFDFIMCCHTKLRLSTPTLTLAFQVLDKYVHSARLHTQMLKDRLTFQMLGVVALWVSSKFMDSKIRHPDLFTLVQLVSYNSASSSSNGNGRDHMARREAEEQRLMGTMRGLELDILRGLDWCVSDIPTHDFFVDILLRKLEGKAAELGMEEINQIKYGAQMLCELACFYPHINKEHSVSEVAYASVFLIRSCLRAAREGSVFATPVTTNMCGVQGGLSGLGGPLEQELFTLFKNCYYALNQDSLFSLPFSFKLKYFPKLPQHYPLFLQSLLYCVSDAHQDTAAMFTTAKVKQHSKAMPPTPNTPSLSKMGKTHAMHNTAMLRQTTVSNTSTAQATHNSNAKRPRAQYETDDETDNDEGANKIDKTQHTGKPLPASYPVKKKLHTELLFIESRN